MRRILTTGALAGILSAGLLGAALAQAPGPMQASPMQAPLLHVAHAGDMPGGRRLSAEDVQPSPTRASRPCMPA